MGTGTSKRPPGAPTEMVPFAKLKRTNVHRTSVPTDRAIRAAAATLAGQRPAGRSPMVDAVVLAALRLATRNGEDHGPLAAEVTRIENETFAVHDPHLASDPGE